MKSIGPGKIPTVPYQISSDLWHATSNHWFELRWLLCGTVGSAPNIWVSAAFCASAMNSLTFMRWPSSLMCLNSLYTVFLLTQKTLKYSSGCCLTCYCCYFYLYFSIWYPINAPFLITAKILLMALTLKSGFLFNFIPSPPQVDDEDAGAARVWTLHPQGGGGWPQISPPGGLGLVWQRQLWRWSRRLKFGEPGYVWLRRRPDGSWGGKPLKIALMFHLDSILLRDLLLLPIRRDRLPRAIGWLFVSSRPVNTINMQTLEVAVYPHQTRQNHRVDSWSEVLGFMERGPTCCW